MKLKTLMALGVVGIPLFFALLTMGVTFVVGFLLYLFESFWVVFGIVFLFWLLICFFGVFGLSKWKQME